MNTIMKWLTTYCQRMGWKRLFLVLGGNILLGMGIGLFRWANLGIDPFSGMNVAVSEFFHFDYPTYQIFLNLALFVIQVIWGRTLIGVGTLINMFLLGHLNSFFYWVFQNLLGALPSSFVISVAAVLIGVLINCLALSMYQTPNVGVAPYDALSLILKERVPKISYFWWRLLFDVTAVGICFAAGGKPGIGTVICAFGLGPIIHLINVNFMDKHVTPMDTTGLYSKAN